MSDSGNPLEDNIFAKCVKVIDGCVNLEQLAVAAKFVALAFTQGHISQLHYQEIFAVLQKRNAEFD